jgi:hypothetical protein
MSEMNGSLLHSHHPSLAKRKWVKREIQFRDFSAKFFIAHKTKYNNLSHYSVGNSIDNLGNIFGRNIHNLGNIYNHNIRNKGGGCMGMDSHNKKEQGYIPNIPSPKREVKLLK